MFFVCFFIFIQNEKSQINPNEVTFSKGNYYYQNKLYKKLEADQLFMVNGEAYDAYHSFRDKNKFATGAAITSAILLPAGFFLLLSDGNSVDGFSRGFIGFLAIPGGIVSGVFAIGSIPLARIQFKKSLNLLNDALKDTNDVGSIPLELNLGVTNHGVGLIFNF